MIHKLCNKAHLLYLVSLKQWSTTLIFKRPACFLDTPELLPAYCPYKMCLIWNHTWASSTGSKKMENSTLGLGLKRPHHLLLNLSIRFSNLLNPFWGQEAAGACPIHCWAKTGYTLDSLPVHCGVAQPHTLKVGHFVAHLRGNFSKPSIYLRDMFVDWVEKPECWIKRVHLRGEHANSTQGGPIWTLAVKLEH